MAGWYADAQAADAGVDALDHRDGAQGLGPHGPGRRLFDSSHGGIAVVGREDVGAAEGKELFGATVVDSIRGTSLQQRAFAHAALMWVLICEDQTAPGEEVAASEAGHMSAPDDVPGRACKHTLAREAVTHVAELQATAGFVRPSS